MERRRRVPRQNAGWSGRFKDENDRYADWGDCLVIDISVLGVGLELFGPVPRDLIGRRIAVEVQTPIGTSVSIRMAGEVRNTAPGPNGGARVGMEFVGLSDTERSILNTLELMQIAW